MICFFFFSVILTSHFSSYLKGLETAFNTQADTLMNRVAEMADGKTKVVMLDEFLHLTLDTIGQVRCKLEYHCVMMKCSYKFILF